MNVISITNTDEYANVISNNKIYNGIILIGKDALSGIGNLFRCVSKGGFIMYDIRDKISIFETVRNVFITNGFLFYSSNTICYGIKVTDEKVVFKYITKGTTSTVYRNFNMCYKVTDSEVYEKMDIRKNLDDIKSINIFLPIRYYITKLDLINCNVIVTIDEFIEKTNDMNTDAYKYHMMSFVEEIKNKNSNVKYADLNKVNIICRHNKLYLIDTLMTFSNCIDIFIKEIANYSSIMTKEIDLLVYKNKQIVTDTQYTEDYINYHKIDGNGRRECNDRVKYFNKDDFSNRTVLDIGCSSGQLLIKLNEHYNIKKGVGIDHCVKSIDDANLTIRRNNINNLEFLHQDIDDIDWFRKIGKFDTVMLLAIMNTSKFSEKNSLISTACRLGRTFYIEGHAGDDHNYYLRLLYYYTDYTKFDHIYINSNGIRPLIRCSYESTFDLCKKKFKSNGN